MREITLDKLDANLLADLDGDTTGYRAYEADYDGSTVANQAWHIVYHPEYQRGGIVFVGSGSSGSTAWTDATSPDDVLSRYLADEMAN